MATHGAEHEYQFYTYDFMLFQLLFDGEYLIIKQLLTVKMVWQSSELLEIQNNDK